MIHLSERISYVIYEKFSWKQWKCKYVKARLGQPEKAHVMP